MDGVEELFELDWWVFLVKKGVKSIEDSVIKSKWFEEEGVFFVE